MLDIETLIQLDLSVDNPTQNVKALRAAIGYIEKSVFKDNINKIIYLSVYGYSGGGMQDSCSYKIQFDTNGEFIIYKGLINPDEWDIEIESNESNEVCIELTIEEKTYFASIFHELSKYLIDCSQIPENESNCMLIKSDFVEDNDELKISPDFDTSYLKLLNNDHWTIWTNWD